MADIKHYIHRKVDYYNFGYFRGPAGPVSYIRKIITADLPPVEKDGPNGWIALTYLSDPDDPNDLAFVLDAADTFITTRGEIHEDLTIDAGYLAMRGARVLLSHGPYGGPSPSETVEALARMMRTRVSRRGAK